MEVIFDGRWSPRSVGLRRGSSPAAVKPMNLIILSWLLLCPAAWAQAWSGIINPSRAVNWSSAGIPGGIPSRTTQCGATIAAYGTSGTPASPSTINTAIAACPAGEFVSLGAGTFYLNAGINLNTNDVTLRGQGADQTFIVLSGHASCNGLYTSVTMCGSYNSPGQEDNVCDWTAGYSPGSTTITLANCGSTAPAKGNLSNLHVGSILELDQADETLDTGQIWNCSAGAACDDGLQGGFSRTDGPCVAGTCIRAQAQIVTVTGIAGSNVTISPGLYMPNWRSGQAPQAWFANTTVQGVGLEDVSLDQSAVTGTDAVIMMNCYQCYVKGIRSLYAARAHIQLLVASHCMIVNSYFYQSQSHMSVSYTTEFDVAGDNIFQNNICQQVTDSCPNNNGGAEGNVFAYNFAVDDVFGTAGYFQGSLYAHTSGDAFNLLEGNVSPGYTSDTVHGTHHLETIFRNYIAGNQAAGCGGAGLNTCTAQTTPLNLYAGSRYYNVIGNVLGTPANNQITTYQYSSSITGATHGGTGGGGEYAIYTLGYTENSGWSNNGLDNGFCLNSGCSSVGTYDPLTPVYLMRWGNYDTVTGAIRWCGNSSDTRWSTTCGSTSEIPTTISPYGNAVPTLGDTGAGQGALPVSFYLSSKPSWFGSAPWPAIGPDVSSGTIGICSDGTYAGFMAISASQCTGGTLATGLGGHANANPAMLCAYNIMGMNVAGTDANALSFNENTCYGARGSSPNPPTNLSAVPQ